mmetsp:Transcript_22837/g.34604  ORF Transcript_22837/g.34604 Transcript_22837/m.34604 type:complete len:95 (-) Transcript_22837:241-525(-)
MDEDNADGCNDRSASEEAADEAWEAGEGEQRNRGKTAYTPAATSAVRLHLDIFPQKAVGQQRAPALVDSMGKRILRGQMWFTSEEPDPVASSSG